MVPVDVVPPPGRNPEFATTEHFTGGRLVPAGPVPRRPRRLFTMTGTLRLFGIVDDRAVPGDG
ncbi:hypothetical protein [Streptomyces sp. NPDC127092]|uniref:hypothetical protein n=1 Tax=Streptomyces sp. NPDC127092 TaxID=3347135 RepID=UPI00365F3E6F